MITEVHSLCLEVGSGTKLFLLVKKGHGWPISSKLVSTGCVRDSDPTLLPATTARLPLQLCTAIPPLARFDRQTDSAARRMDFVIKTVDL